MPVSASAPAETVDVAQSPGELSVGLTAGASGTIGVGPAGAADVAWYHFTLDAPAAVSFSAGPGSSRISSDVGIDRAKPWSMPRAASIS